MESLEQRIKYIKRKEENGIDYDLNKVRELYCSLGIPPEYWIPPIDYMADNPYLIAMSERSNGKTTNVVLLGLCFNRLYGTVIQYVRDNEKQITQNMVGELTKVINTYNHGQYVQRLTDGRYNSLVYHKQTKTFHYALRGVDGAVEEEDGEPCIKVLSIDNHEDYKSGYNAPLGDIIIFDEFVQEYYRINSFLEFFDLHSTIRRNRLSVFCFLLANTTNINSPWFEEFEITKYVRNCKQGEHMQIVTEKGTHIYFEILMPRMTAKKQEENAKYYGFQNPRLDAITGNSTWACPYVQHMPKGKVEDITKNLYLQIAQGLYLACDIVRHEEYGVCMFVHRASKLRDDTIVLSLKEDDIGAKDKHFYGFSNKKMAALFQRFLRRRRVYYATNEIGADFKAFCLGYKAAPEIL